MTPIVRRRPRDATPVSMSHPSRSRAPHVGKAVVYYGGNYGARLLYSAPFMSHEHFLSLKNSQPTQTQPKVVYLQFRDLMGLFKELFKCSNV